MELDQWSMIVVLRNHVLTNNDTFKLLSQHIDSCTLTRLCALSTVLGASSRNLADLFWTTMYIIEVTDFKFEVKYDLQSCFEAAVASEAEKGKGFIPYKQYAHGKVGNWGH